MVCYKDMTFCPYYTECEPKENCVRALTSEVKKAAKEFGLPISQFIERPDCNFLPKDNWVVAP